MRKAKLRTKIYRTTFFNAGVFRGYRKIHKNRQCISEMNTLYPVHFSRCPLQPIFNHVTTLKTCFSLIQSVPQRREEAKWRLMWPPIYTQWASRGSLAAISGLSTEKMCLLLPSRGNRLEAISVPSEEADGGIRFAVGGQNQ